MATMDGCRQPQQYIESRGEFCRVDSAHRGKRGGEIPGRLSEEGGEAGGHNFDVSRMEEEL